MKKEIRRRIDEARQRRNGVAVPGAIAAPAKTPAAIARPQPAPDSIEARVASLVHSAVGRHHVYGKMFFLYGENGRHYSGMANVSHNGHGPQVCATVNDSPADPAQYLANLRRCMTGISVVCDEATAHAVCGPFEGTHYKMQNGKAAVDIYVGRV